MFRYKKLIALGLALLFIFVCIFYGYCYNNKVKLNNYISQININNFNYNYLIVENNEYDVSIDTTIFKLGLESEVNRINENIKIDYLELNRYSKIIKLKYSYKNVSRIVEYELIRNR